MTIDRRSFLRALGITPAAIVAAKYLPEAPPPAPAHSALIQQYTPPSDVGAEANPFPSDSVILRIDEDEYHALEVEMNSHADHIDVTSFYDSSRSYIARVPERREVVIRCAGLHKVGKFTTGEKAACQLLLGNGASVDFSAYVVDGDWNMGRYGRDFTRLRLQVDGEVTLRRC